MENECYTYEIDGWIVTKLPEPLYTKEQIQNFKVLKVIELNEEDKLKNATNHPRQRFSMP